MRHVYEPETREAASASAPGALQWPHTADRSLAGLTPHGYDLHRRTASEAERMRPYHAGGASVAPTLYPTLAFRRQAQRASFTWAFPRALWKEVMKMTT